MENLIKFGSYLHILLFLNSSESSKIFIYYFMDENSATIKATREDDGAKDKWGVSQKFLLSHLSSDSSASLDATAEIMMNQLIPDNPLIPPFDIPLLILQLHREGLKGLNQSRTTNPDCFLEISVKPDNRNRKIHYTGFKR